MAKPSRAWAKPSEIVDSALGWRFVNPLMRPIDRNLATISLGPDNVLVPEGLEVASIEPNTIQVDLEREVTQRIQVVPQLMGRPAAGTAAGEPEVFPNQVLVTGPEPMLARIDALSTRPVNLDGHALTFEESVAVVPPDPLIQIVQPTKVTVRVPMQQPSVGPTPAKPRKEKRKGKP